MCGGLAFTVTGCVAEGLVVRTVLGLGTHAVTSTTAKLVRFLTGLGLWALTQARVLVELLGRVAVISIEALALAGRLHPDLTWATAWLLPVCPTSTAASTRLWVQLLASWAAGLIAGLTLTGGVTEGFVVTALLWIAQISCISLL